VYFAGTRWLKMAQKKYNNNWLVHYTTENIGTYVLVQVDAARALSPENGEGESQKYPCTCCDLALSVNIR